MALTHTVYEIIIDVIKRTIRFGFRCTQHTHTPKSLSSISFNHSMRLRFILFMCNICVFSFYDFSLPQIICISTGWNAVDFEANRGKERRWDVWKTKTRWTRILCFFSSLFELSHSVCVDVQSTYFFFQFSCSSMKQLYTSRLVVVSICFICSNAVELQSVQSMINRERFVNYCWISSLFLSFCSLLFFVSFSIILFVATNYQCKEIKWKWWMNFEICSENNKKKSFKTRDSPNHFIHYAHSVCKCVCVFMSEWSIWKCSQSALFVWKKKRYFMPYIFFSFCVWWEFLNAKNT